MKRKSLRELQLAFVAALQAKEISPEFLAMIQSTPDLNAQQRMFIYRNSIVTGIVQALAATYPVCQQLVGDTFFQGMASAYFQQYPAEVPDLNAYGANFSEFIMQYATADSVPYLADMARLEWAWVHALRAPMARAVNLSAIPALSPNQQQQLIFELTPNSSLLSSTYPIHQIWQFHQAELAEKTIIDWKMEIVYLFIWQQSGKVIISEVGKKLWEMLQALAQATCMQDLCERFSEDEITQNLPEIVRCGWIKGYTAYT